LPRGAEPATARRRAAIRAAQPEGRVRIPREPKRRAAELGGRCYDRNILGKVLRGQWWPKGQREFQAARAFERRWELDRDVLRHSIEAALVGDVSD